MPDNSILPAIGDVIASDEIAGVKYQRVKLVLGGDGVNEGDVASGNRLPVHLATLPLPAGASTEATLAALNVIAAAVQSAVEAINAKTTAVNTGAVAGTVALDGGTLAALETINANTGGLTDAQLRAAALAVTAAALPLPAGAATETTLATLAGAVKAEDAASADGDPGIVILAQRRDTDATAVSTDGDYGTLKTDEEGRLKVSSKPASYADIIGDITAVQATIGTPVAGGTVTGDVSRASNVMAFCTGTFNTINCTFEGSLEATGDANWFGIQAVRSNANTIETATGNLSAAPAYAWEMSVNGLKRVRVRCTARTSGTQSWRFVLGTYATEPIPAAQVSATQPVSGTVTATVGTSISGGTISPLTVAGSSAEASSAKTASGNSAAGLTNASGRNAHFIINVSAASGTSPTLVVRVQIQDPVSSAWVDLPGAVTSTITGVSATLLSVTNLPRTYRLAWVIGGTTPSFTFSVGMLPVI